MKKSRLLTSLVLAIILLMAFSVPAFASVAQPDSLDIWGFYAFESVLEDGDQLYIVAYDIDYASLPTDGASINYIFTLEAQTGTGLVSIGIVESTVAYDYHEQGYGRGIVSFYLTADEVDPTLPWGEINRLTMYGNPTLEWAGGDPPVLTQLSFTGVFSPTGGYLTGTIISLATTLEVAWVGVDLLQSTTTGTILTDEGIDYFVRSIPNLASMAADLFGAASSSPVFPEDRAHPTTQADTYKNQWVGTFLDFTDLATAFAIPVSFIYAIIWVIAMVLVMYGVTRAANNYKPAVIMMIPMSIFGGLLGFLPMLATIALTAIMGIVGAWSLFYKST